MIELLLDTIFAFEIIGTLYVLIVSRTIFHFLILCFAVAWLVRISMGLSRTMGRYISKNFMAKEPFNNPLKSYSLFKLNGYTCGIILKMMKYILETLL